MTGLFIITGHWKNDKTVINALVSPDSEPSGIEDDYDIFHYDMTEEVLNKAIQDGENSDFEFVVKTFIPHHRL